MNDTKHTPLPWKVCGASEGKCSCHLIWSVPADCPVAVALTAADEPYTGGEGVGHDEAAENALAISKAMNSFGDMLEALKGVWAGVPSTLRGTIDLPTSLQPIPTIALLSETLRKVRAAIEKAEKS